MYHVGIQIVPRFFNCSPTIEIMFSTLLAVLTIYIFERKYIFIIDQLFKLTIYISSTASGLLSIIYTSLFLHFFCYLQENRLKTLVFKPLCSLQELMAGPRNLIRKRQDKLLDYELIEEKSSLNFDEQAIANTYKTMNTLLLTELPQFNGKALQLLWATLEAFSCLQRDLAADMEQLATSFTHQVLFTENEEVLLNAEDKIQ